MTFELPDGNMITPLGVFDVLDAVEEYMGPDTRQYLEDCFRDDNPWENMPDDEKVESLLEHFGSIMDAIEDLVAETDALMQKSTVKRKQVMENLTLIQRIIDKERSNYGKEDV